MKEIWLRNLEIVARAAGFPEPQSLAEIIGAIIGTVLSFVGIIFLIMIIYGGFTWMISAGNEQKVYKAKKIIVNSIIGTVIIMSSYEITRFVFSALQSTMN